MTARTRSPAGLLGALASLATVACKDDACEGRSFDPLPEPQVDADSPPTIVAGAWIGPGILELQFSKPIASMGDLDPKRFAILAWDAQVWGGDYCHEQTSYRALSASYYYYNPQDPIAAVWIGPEDDTLLRLRLSNTAAQCPVTIAATSLASGVMLVYTKGDATTGPVLLTDSGDPIASIGPQWAITALDRYLDGDVGSFVFGELYSGHLPKVDALPSIPCP